VQHDTTTAFYQGHCPCTSFVAIGFYSKTKTERVNLLEYYLKPKSIE